MQTAPEPEIDVLVVGAGIAGLWILDALVREGFSAVAVEAAALGAGQSVAAQGIIHGGLKYTLRERDLASTGSIAAMPELWRRLHDTPDASGPDLASATVSSPCTWIWRTDSLASRIGMLGARAALRTRREPVDLESRPSLLRSVPGSVLRVEEPVFDTRSVLAAIAARHRGRVLAVDGPEGLELSSRGGTVDRVVLRHGEAAWTVRPRCVVLAAGLGNERILARLGLDDSVCQRRPLHMGLLRAEGLPDLHGHCVDGNRTRLTVTSGRDRAGRTVWQLGGELAEQGVRRAETEQVAAAVREVASVLPDLDLDAHPDAAWSSYRVDRAEARTRQGLRPDDAVVLPRNDSRLLVTWPTKWALAPRLAAAVLESLPAAVRERPGGSFATDALPSPPVADFPWEDRQWTPHRDAVSAART